MHIPDGILTGPGMAVTSAAAAAGVAIALAKLDYRQIPRVGVLSAVFFIASLIHIPIGPASVHLLLTGLIGCLLGWAAFAALAAAMLLQAIVFSHGGLTSLGTNVLITALPAVACYELFGRHIRPTSSRRRVFVLAFSAGGLGVAIGCGLFATTLVLAGGREYLPVVGALFVGHIPVMIIEGFVTSSALLFFHKVRPELLSIQAAGGATLE